MRSRKRTIRRKSRRRQRGGDAIVPEDVLYQDRDVCILKPEVKKGILVFTGYTQPAGAPPLCETGLKTGAQMRSEGIDFGRRIFHPYIFFRAPYLSGPIDYTSVDTEIQSSFGEGRVGMSSLAWIRVDPAKTFVYSSEIRAHYSPGMDLFGEFTEMVPFGTERWHLMMENEVSKSRKSMTAYLRILNENKAAMQTIEPGQRAVYHLWTSEVRIQPYVRYGEVAYPFNEYDIAHQSEVLVRIPHMTPNYFVRCT